MKEASEMTQDEWKVWKQYIRIKPCPICGDDATIWERRCGRNFALSIKCDNESCGCNTTMSMSLESTIKDLSASELEKVEEEVLRKDLLRRWNRRIPDPVRKDLMNISRGIQEVRGGMSPDEEGYDKLQDLYYEVMDLLADGRSKRDHVDVDSLAAEEYNRPMSGYDKW